MASLVASVTEPIIVETCEVRTILVTGVLPLEYAQDFVRLTGVEDHPWGGRHGPERLIVLRVALTPTAVSDMVRNFANMKLWKPGGH